MTIDARDAAPLAATRDMFVDGTLSHEIGIFMAKIIKSHTTEQCKLEDYNVENMNYFLELYYLQDISNSC